MTAAPMVQPDPFPDSGVNARLTPKPCRCNRPRRAKRYKENPEYIASLRAMIRRTVIRVGGQGDVEGLADLAGLHDEVERAIADSVTELRNQDFAWSEIGRVLGISRQAAQQKYGRSR